MKSIISAFFLACIILFVSGCSDKTEKIVDNLKAAANNEMESMTNYAVYAANAANENHFHIANLFIAIATADNIHMRNHWNVLKSMDIKFILDEYTVKDEPILVNLRSAINAETHKSTKLYPKFIRSVENGNNEEAETSFQYALKTSEKNRILFKEALNELETSGNDENIPSVWFVCPQCGDVYSGIGEISQCQICREEKNKFIRIEEYY